MSGPAAILFVILSTIAGGGLAFALLQPLLAREKKVEQRRSQFIRDESDRAASKAARDRLQEQVKRRRTIQSSLKELEVRNKERDKHTSKLSLARRLEQAGTAMTPKQFIWLSAVLGLVALVLALMFKLQVFAAVGIAFVAGFGLPRFFLSRARKKRLQKFTDEFPNSVDLIVRGIKSGLPLNDTLRMVASESPEPVASEFRKIVESQQMGMPIGDAVARLYRNIPTSEANFFSIVIGIQAQAGGNLSEALGNLSKVLRERKKMKGKIQAMSMEAKASGAIIGALPFLVFLIICVTTPDYMVALYTTNIGKIMMLGGAIWMGMGIFVMKQMISFDF
ncbi:type II secretion system F family protein [Aurantimonas sp. VKM B-3413]|uniref:type II secretion system F family protein n=1 Tax=Aurantimonas sp. VKM B-3413 TaxID=2779401 RepID=UPI001E588991|nr:type II secretion system F family protein [Aurantimonas sp. VKM B-3413]MCB8836813.1 type II secretion system F family protein [Aurantimonas sp. VKM B-3413]